MLETWVWFLGWEDPLEKEMATHSSILAWKVPRTEEAGRLQSIGLQDSDMTWHSFFPSFFLFLCRSGILQMGTPRSREVKLIVQEHIIQNTELRMQPKPWSYDSFRQFCWYLFVYLRNRRNLTGEWAREQEGSLSGVSWQKIWRLSLGWLCKRPVS